jgi:hypothetical protein
VVGRGDRAYLRPETDGGSGGGSVGRDLEKKGPFSVGRETRAGPPSFRLFTKMAKINRPHVRVPEEKEHPVEERPSLALRDCSYVIPGESPCPTTDDM